MSHLYCAQGGWARRWAVASGNVSGHRWGVDMPNGTAGARDRLIDATEACFHRFGVAKTTVEDVAETAQVSRATVYRYFTGRDELLLAVLLRHAQAFLGRLAVRLDAAADLSDAIVNGVAFTVTSVRKDDTLALLFAPEASGHTTSVAGASKALFEMSIEFLRPLLAAAQAEGRLQEGIAVDDAAEWLLRIIVSLLTMDGPRRRTEPQLKSLVRAFVVPALVVAAPSAEAD